MDIKKGAKAMDYNEWIRETLIKDLCLSEGEIEQLDDILEGSDEDD